MARRTLPRSLRSAPLFPAWTVGLLLLGAVVAGAVLGWPYALTAVGRFLVVDDNPGKADAIVVLSGDGGARLEQGVELFEQNCAPVLIVVGGGQPGNPPAAQVMRNEATAEGIPSSAVLMVGQSASTREDALYTRELMVQRGLKSAILVTSPYHQRRAALTFGKAFEGTGISVSSFPVRDDQWHPDNWWQDRRSLRITLTELAKLVYYKLAGYI